MHQRVTLIQFRYVVTGGNTSPLIRHLKREHKNLFVEWWWSLSEEKQRQLRSKSEYGDIDSILTLHNNTSSSASHLKKSFFEPVQGSHVNLIKDVIYIYYVS